MAEYPSNSFKTRIDISKDPPAPEKKIQPVELKSTVTVRKKSIFHKFTDAFITDDLGSVKSYVINDLLIPGLKRMLLSSLEMLLGVKGYSSSKNERQSTWVSYKNAYEKASNPNISPAGYFDVGEIVFKDIADARDVQTQMIDASRMYPVVTVSDMFEMARQIGPYTGNRYGWTEQFDKQSLPIIPVRDGYVIKTPKPIPIDYR